MAKIIKQLQSGDNKIIAFDIDTKQFYEAELKPIKLANLTEEEILEASQMSCITLLKERN